jgi:RNA polymerase sigma-70 factor (ECF subfamily)
MMNAGAQRTTAYELVERVRGGDTDAFRELFERYHHKLALLIHYKLGEGLRSALETDDAVQETFLEAARDLARFEYRSPGSFYRWLAAIAGHVLEDAARHQARRKRDGGKRVPLRSASQPGGVEPVDPGLTPTRILFAQERMRELMARLDALPAQYREVILLAKFEGLTTPEIAARLGKQREQVALLLHRALTRLRTGGEGET